MKKQMSFKQALIALGAALSFATLQPASAEENVSAPNEANSAVPHHHHHGKYRAAMHQCVQQALASQGLALPPHVPGQKPNLDPALKTAVKAAHRSCWAQVKASESTGG